MSEFYGQDTGAETAARLRIDRRLRRALGALYQRALRPLLPLRGTVMYSDIIVADRRWGDSLAPKHWTPDLKADIADYEFALVQGLSRTVRPGDAVVVVGGGLGVTVAHAAKLVGLSGRVACYEGSPNLARRTARTAALNGVEGRVRVECATVGAAVAVYQGKDEVAAPVMSAKLLPPCEVLELDCEGAELQILREMSIRPRAVLVETHGMLGAPARVVRAMLEGLGYQVSDLGLAEPRLADLCKSNDVRVLCGERA